MHHEISVEEIEALRRAARLMVRELGLHRDAYFDIGVTLAERHLLIELAASLYPDVGSIAERLLLDKSTASRLISKAVKKGFVAYSLDERDRRRRCLQLTRKGKETLDAIEPLAQKQVRDALQMLSKEEVGLVLEGMDVFAKALAKVRLRKAYTLEPIAPQDNVALAHLALAQQEEAGIKRHRSPDAELQAMYEVYQKPGSAYFVLRKGAKVVGGAGIAQNGGKRVCELRKMFLEVEARGLGLDALLLEACLIEAKRQGYHTCFGEIPTGINQGLFLDHGFVRRKKAGSPCEGFEKSLSYN